MRNLKKFLALVLAMVMAFSLMLSASATDISKFEDQDKVTDEFVEAVAVLTGLNVIKGDGDEENPSIRPQDEITRAEAAALVYRIVTGDINDTQVGLYADYSDFTDVKPRTAADAGDWFAGYVGYCQNAGIIKGKSATHFDPYGKVTGYEVLAMILRAVGYGKNGEFEGANWQVNVASLGKTKHITDSVTSVLYEGELQNYTLNKNARREIVAELLFRGSLLPQVKWTALSGYSEFKSNFIVNPDWDDYNESLASEVFGLYHEGWKEIDIWGNPGYLWKAQRNPTSTTPRTVATIKAEPSYSFYVTQRECDIAHELDFDDEMTAYLYVNGDNDLSTSVVDPVTTTYKIVATDTVTKVGGEGRLVNIYTAEDLEKQSHRYNTDQYWDRGNYWNDGRSRETNVVTMMDTMLAKVVSKTDSVLDAAGHVITPAKLKVNVFSVNKDNSSNVTEVINTAEPKTISKGSTDATNWEQNVGDVILMNAYTNHSGRTQQIDKEKAAFETDPLIAENRLVEGKTINIIDPPTVITGKQSSVSWNSGKHNVEGDEKIDALTFDLDEAGTNINTTYNWYFDKYGKLIGVEETANVRYGVITSVYASVGQGETSTNGTAKAIATVLYADGTTGTEEIDYFMVHGTQVATRGTVSDEMTAKTGATADQNLVQLWPVYDVSGKAPMLEEKASVAFSGVTFNPEMVAVTDDDLGVIYMTPVAASNAASAASADTTVNKHGILNNNLFKFVKSTNDTTVAVEVAGGDASSGWTTSDNDSWYAGHFATATDTATNNATLNKSLAYLDMNNGGYQTIVAWLDNDTRIIFRDEATGKLSTYAGISSLPGNITVTASNPATTGNGAKLYGEVDWADTDRDGRADVMYISGSIAGQTTYGLFYYNRTGSNWDGTNATATGWLNGEQTTLHFDSLDLLNKVRNATVRNAADTADEVYAGHLFAVKMFNGVVTDVLERGGAKNGAVANTTVNLLANWDDAVSGKYANKTAEVFTAVAGANFTNSIFNSAGTADFEEGVGNTDPKYTGNNPYSANTQAVYYKDSTSGAVGATNLTFEPDVIGGVVKVNGNTTYYTNPNTKIYGIGEGVLLASGVTAAAYLNEYDENDVTIIYDVSGSVLEMYVGIDPDVTPSGRPSTGAAPAYSAGVQTLAFTGAENAQRTALGNYLNNVMGNEVFACSSVKLDNTDRSDAENLLYFPFSVPTHTAAAQIVLTIKDANGNVAYTETASDAANRTTVGHGVTRVDVTAEYNTATGQWRTAYSNGLTSGTYSYIIELTAGTQYNVLSQGSFTVE